MLHLAANFERIRRLEFGSCSGGLRHGRHASRLEVERGCPAEDPIKSRPHTPGPLAWGIPLGSRGERLSARAQVVKNRDRQTQR
jgi:hypothetical protein